MGKYFGTDGWRGEAGVTLTAEDAYKIGRFLGFYFKTHGGGKIAIGKDTRRSSYMLEYALGAGICASGADAYLLHVTTTPSVAYTVRTEDFDCGVMISASHNPFWDNGIKLISASGEKMTDEMTAKIEEYIDSREELPLATGAKIGRTVDYVQGRNRYTGYLIGGANHSYKGYRIGIDAANGAAWMLAKKLFDTLGAKTYVIGNEPNGTNINDGCGSTDTKALRALVLKEKLDIGFAFDGDADRLIAVDEGGGIISGENILYFMAKYMKARGELPTGTVVTTVMSNAGLADALKNEGILCSVTDVGDRFVWERMQEGGHALGGEDSGHIIFSKYSTTGDGLISAIRVMEALIESGGAASELSRGLTLYPKITKNVRVRDKDAVLGAKCVREAYEKCEKMLHGVGRILLRKSGTEPVVRVMAEHTDEALCREITDLIAEAIEAASN